MDTSVNAVYIYYGSLALLGLGAVSNLFMGLLVLRRFTHSLLHISYFFMTLFLGAWSLLNFLWVLSPAFQTLVLNRASFASLPLAAVFYLYFLVLAPRHGMQKIGGWVPWLGVYSVAWAGISFTPLVLKDLAPGGWGKVSVFGLLFWPYVVSNVTLLIIGIVHLHLKIRATRDPFDLIRLKLVALATWLPGLIAPPLFFIPYFLSPDNVGGEWLTVMMPATTSISAFVTAYAIMRYQFLDVRLLGHSATITVLHGIIHAAVIGVLVKALLSVRDPGALSSVHLSLFAMIFFAALLYPSAHLVMGKIVKKLFYRDENDLEKELWRFSGRLSGSRPLDELALEICSLLRHRFMASGAVICAHDADMNPPIRIVAADPPHFNFEIPGDITALLIDYTASATELVTRYEIEVFGESHPLRGALQFMMDAGVEVFIPLAAAGRCVGGIFIGRAEKGATYSAERLDLLRMLAAAAVPALLSACHDERIEDQRQRYRQLFERAGDAILILSGANRSIRESNSRAGDLFREDGHSLLDANFMDFVPAEQRALVEKHITGMDRGANGLPEVSLRTRDGGAFTAEIFAVDLPGGDVFVNIRDITDRKRTEDELLKMKKIESLGVLAGGIAHDFNNMLAAICGNISLARSAAVSGQAEKLPLLLDRTEEACMRSSRLTKQLLTFSRGGAPIKKAASMSEVLAETSLFTLRGSNVRCDVRISDGLWAVEMDEGQISQVIQNLVMNAAQAMPDGGIVTLSAENVEIDASNCPLPLAGGRYVKVLVQDHGPGIPETNISRVFDPYFTTKDKGSGLGLAIAYSIISRHSGHITVESTGAQGTAFVFYLPASDAHVPYIAQNIRNLKTGSGKILIMDDDELIRVTLQDLFESLGYTVAVVDRGEAAVEEFKKEFGAGRPFDAVILDLTVPGGLGGVETLKQLKVIEPGVRAIVGSGYSNDPVMANHEVYGFAAIFSKPFNATELSSTLHHVLNSGSTKHNGL